MLNIDICNWLQLSKHCHHCSIIKHNYCYLICILYLHIHMYMYNLRLCFFAFWISFLTLFTTEHSFGSLSFLQVQEILKNHHHHHPSPASHSQLAHSFVFFWKHLTLVDISLPSITLSAIAHSRAVCMMSSAEKCLLGLIHSWTWLQKGLPRSPCWVFSNGRAHNMCTCWGDYPSPWTKFTCSLHVSYHNFAHSNIIKLKNKALVQLRQY